MVIHRFLEGSIAISQQNTNLALGRTGTKGQIQFSVPVEVIHNQRNAEAATLRFGKNGPPPGAGLVTVMYPAVGLATSAARIFACSSREEIKVVERGLPFQLTIAPETKLAP